MVGEKVEDSLFANVLNPGSNCFECLSGGWREERRQCEFMKNVRFHKWRIKDKEGREKSILHETDRAGWRGYDTGLGVAVLSYEL